MKNLKYYAAGLYLFLFLLAVLYSYGWLGGATDKWAGLMPVGAAAPLSWRVLPRVFSTLTGIFGTDLFGFRVTTLLVAVPCALLNAFVIGLVFHLIYKISDKLFRKQPSTHKEL